jgi:hypothetical protein
MTARQGISKAVGPRYWTLVLESLGTHPIRSHQDRARKYLRDFIESEEKAATVAPADECSIGDYTVAELAQTLGTALSTITGWLQAGLIPEAAVCFLHKNHVPRRDQAPASATATVKNSAFSLPGSAGPRASMLKQRRAFDMACFVAH